MGKGSTISVRLTAVCGKKPLAVKFVSGSIITIWEPLFFSMKKI